MSKPALQHSLELLSHLSLRSLYRVARVIALFLRNTSNRVSRQTRENIKLCFPELAPAEQQRLYRDSIRHTCNAMTELAALWCWPTDTILDRVTSVDVCDSFYQNARAKIVLAPHLGCWELLVLWLGWANQALILYKRPKNRALEKFIYQARARTGGSPVPTKKRGLRKLLVGLKQGATLMILPDQKPRKSRVSIGSEIFGNHAPTTKLVQNLCSKVDCDVFIATMCRSSPPGEFELRIEPLQRELLATDENRSAQYMNDQIERVARQYLEQYQWGYRRFSAKAYATDIQGT